MCRGSSFHRILLCTIISLRSVTLGRRRRSFDGRFVCSPYYSRRRQPPTYRPALATSRHRWDAEASVLKDVIGIVPILRAGLGMAEGVIDLLPDAEVWHIGLYRDETTLRPARILQQVPGTYAGYLVLLVDPMLATGGSAARACEIIKSAGVTRLKLLSLIAAPEGIALLNRLMPDVVIHVGAVDSGLNEVGFIYPGLGDAGDRQFGTGVEPSEE